MTFEDILDVIGKRLNRHRSYDIDSDAGILRGKAYFFSDAEQSKKTLFGQIRNVMNNNISGKCDQKPDQDTHNNTVILEFPNNKETGEIAVEVTRMKKQEFENYVEVAVNRISGISIYDRIDPKTGKYVAKLQIQDKPLISFAIDMESGKLVYKNKGKWTLVAPLMFNKYFDSLLYSYEILRDIFTDILNLSARYNPFLKDIASSIRKTGFFGFGISIESLMQYHNLNEFFHSRIDRHDVPINFNSLSFYEGVMVMMLLPHIPQSEYSFFAQQVKNKTVFECFMGRTRNIYEHWWRKTPYHLEQSDYVLGTQTILAKEFLMSYYVTKGIINETDEAELSDLISMKKMLGTEAAYSLRYRSHAGIRRAHDDTMNRLRHIAGADGNLQWLLGQGRKYSISCDPQTVIVPEESKFGNLREILPEEFEWITTAGRIERESYDQHNCVRTYASRVINDECAIYHWEIEDRKYTIEFTGSNDQRIDNRYYIRQIKQKYNREALPEDETIVRGYISRAV